MKKIRLNVKTKSKIYPIIIGKNIIAQTSNILKSNNSYILNHINENNVPQCYQNGKSIFLMRTIIIIHKENK